jgi:DNA-binding NarL/FixJ family response regulator
MYTVLVVDDSPDCLSLINDILEKEGISTLVALEGSQAITIAEQIVPDIILLDAVMPKMNGFETCTRLKQNRALSHIPVVFMTGLKEPENILKGLNAGGVDYVFKPVNPEELIARIRTHVNNAHLTTSAQKALDSIGQTLFTISAQGDLLWATPLTHDFLSNIPYCDDWLKECLLPFVTEINQSLKAVGTVDKIDHQGGTCELTLVSRQPSGDCTFRICHYTVTPSSEDKLKIKLNITSRESEVLYWLSNGKTNKEIGMILNIGSRTVNKHLEQVFVKLGVENRTTAAGIAIRALSEA